MGDLNPAAVEFEQARAAIQWLMRLQARVELTRMRRRRNATDPDWDIDIDSRVSEAIVHFEEREDDEGIALGGGFSACREQIAVQLKRTARD